jgi:hypothetical protein
MARRLSQSFVKVRCEFERKGRTKVLRNLHASGYPRPRTLHGRHYRPTEEAKKVLQPSACRRFRLQMGWCNEKEQMMRLGGKGGEGAGPRAEVVQLRLASWRFT